MIQERIADLTYIIHNFGKENLILQKEDDRALEMEEIRLLKHIKTYLSKLEFD